MVERQKEELNYFYGSRAFQLMKDLSQDQVKSYMTVGDVVYDGSYEFKWLREYKRCMLDCLNFFSCFEKYR